MRLAKIAVPGRDPYYLVGSVPTRVSSGWATFTLRFVRVRRGDRAAGRAIALWLLAKAVMSS